MTNQLQTLEKQLGDTLIEHLGIEITTLEKSRVSGKMPVDRRTTQPSGVLHGGASAAFAETLASIGGMANVDFPDEMAIGVEVNANHIRAVRKGWVLGVATPAHIGNMTQVWEIRITNEAGELICLSRVTLANLKQKQEQTAR